MRVTLLGTGDTTGTPTPNCYCDTCAAARERGVERSRFSVHVQGPDGALLVDVSPDFRAQFLENDVALPDAAVVTHVHFDHVAGLGNAYRLLGGLPVYASSATDETTGESVAETVRERYDYLDRVVVHAVDPFEPFRACGLDCRLVPVEHPPLDSYGLVVEDSTTGGTLAMTGDTNAAIDERSRRALAGADLLLADAIVPASQVDGQPQAGDHVVNGVPHTFAGKHMTRAGALALAEELDPERLRLVHVAHFYPADEAFTEPLAVDGETFDL